MKTVFPSTAKQTVTQIHFFTRRLPCKEKTTLKSFQIFIIKKKKRLAPIMAIAKKPHVYKATPASLI